MKSIKIKLMFLYLTLVFIVMIIIGTYILSSLKNYEQTKINSDIINYANYVDEQIINNLETPQNFQHGLENILYSAKNDMQCSILNSRGTTIASTSLPYENFNNQSIIQAMTGVENFSYLKEKNDGKIKIWYNYARPSEFYPDSYIIFIRVNSADFLDNMSKMTFTLILSLLLALTLAGIIGFLFAGTLTGPIRNLTKKAKQIANGNFEQKIVINSNDEIGELTESFNYMTQRLNKAMHELTMENNKLEIILQNMNDGVMYFDAGGNLVQYNYAAQNLFDFHIDNLNFDALAKKLNLSNNLAGYKNNIRQSNDESVNVNQKYLNTNFIPYKNKGKLEGILIVIQDITKHKKLDDMRKEFVANVSHEIRTPLTTIKSYTETLLNGAIDDKKTSMNFLTTINNVTDTMSLLVKDLLELSRFDNNQMKLEFATINLVDTINKSIEQNKILAINKNQQINFTQQNEIYRIRADANRIVQVFSNIISNAIKYSPENKSIDINIEKTAKYIRVYVKDYGYGIPKDDLHNIFERFYRVDKARSRMMGGTGLGLAIAKEIIHAHDGKIAASSKLNVGTTMIVRFKKMSGDGNE